MVFINVAGGKSLIAPRALKHSIRHNCGFGDNFFRDNIAFRQKLISNTKHLLVHKILFNLTTFVTCILKSCKIEICDCCFAVTYQYKIENAHIYCVTGGSHQAWRINLSQYVSAYPPSLQEKCGLHHLGLRNIF